MAAHQGGDLATAESLYAAILAEQPNHCTVLHLLGVLNNQRGDFAAAEPLLARALRLNPRSPLAHFNMGLALWGMERPEEAVTQYQHTLLLKPDDHDALLNCALALQSLDRPRESLERWNQLLALDPQNQAGLLNRGIVLQDLHRSSEAEASFELALALDSAVADALLLRSQALRRAGRVDEALATVRKALGRRPDWAEGLLLWAATLVDLGRATEAVDVYDRLRALCPDSVDVHLDRGNALMGLQCYEAALASYERVLALQPQHLNGLMNRGTALLQLQLPMDALQSYEKVLALHPDHADSHLNRGNALLRLGRPQEALISFDRALGLRPVNPEALLNQANALLALGRSSEALSSCDRALALKPDCVDAFVNRGTALLDLKRPVEALADFDAALALKPDYPDLLTNRGTALHLLGRHRDAIGCYERALVLDPGHARAHSNKIYILGFIPEVGFLEHQMERRNYCDAHAQRWAGHAPPPHDRRPDRRLVLGYVSADFRHHSAASCFLPILERHSRTEFQVNCYSGVQVEDDWTRRFRSCAEVWRTTPGMSDEALAARIRDDGVDILIDLSGHSKGNRLLVFARKPAPVQVTAWGHGGGTGLPMVDYQFTDPVSIPPQARPFFAEEAWDLPCFIGFEAPAFAPPVADSPARSTGAVTYGSLNRFTKVTPAALRLWARILQAQPGSRLLLKDAQFDEPRGREAVLAALAGVGIDEVRVELRGFTSHSQHLAAYGGVDIMLDTFPQNGGVTTWESLWMGVPVVAMLGNKLASRISAAVLSALALTEWVAENEEGYFRIAVEKGSDPESLRRFRTGIRSRILASPAGNPDLYTRAVEAAYRAMWRKLLTRG